MFDCPQPLYTPALWHNVNPVLEYRVQFTALKTSPELLNYLQSSALVLELWGLQGEEGSVTALHLHCYTLVTHAVKPTALRETLRPSEAFSLKLYLHLL